MPVKLPQLVHSTWPWALPLTQIKTHIAALMKGRKFFMIFLGKSGNSNLMGFNVEKCRFRTSTFRVTSFLNGNIASGRGPRRA